MGDCGTQKLIRSVIDTFHDNHAAGHGGVTHESWAPMAFLPSARSDFTATAVVSGGKDVIVVAGGCDGGDHRRERPSAPKAHLCPEPPANSVATAPAAATDQQQRCRCLQRRRGSNAPTKAHSAAQPRAVCILDSGSAVPVWDLC